MRRALAARDEQTRPVRHGAPRSRGRRRQQVLDVVEQHEQRLAAEMRAKRLFERCPALFAHRKRLRERGKDELRIAEWRERHPEHAVREGLRGLRCRLQSEPRLAGAPGPVSVSSRDPSSVRSSTDLRELCSRPEEGRRRDRQVRPVQRLEGGKSRSPSW